jgi:hypothetical protein
MSEPEPASYTSNVATQRAYTLRLRAAQAAGSAGKAESQAALWATHSLFNCGAAAFGELLLTMRGGLPHELAEGAEEPADSRCARRVLLSLCWLTVEDRRSAPADFRVAPTGTVARLRGILARRGLPPAEIDTWANDTGPSLRARIRDDATWVDRSAAFDAMSARIRGLNRAASGQFVGSFFGAPSIYLAQEGGGEDEREGVRADFRAKARQWVSRSFGTGEKTDPSGIAARLRALAQVNFAPCVGRPGADLARVAAKSLGLSASGTARETLAAIVAAVGWKGRASKGRLALQRATAAGEVSPGDIAALAAKLIEEAAEKDREPPPATWAALWLPELEEHLGARFISGRDLTGEFATMLDHSARRVSAMHSWVKLAENRRRSFAVDAAKRSSLLARAPQAVAWLDSFCRSRSASSGAAREGYRIRRRAIAGWDDLVDAWSRPDCRSSEDRVAAARGLQGEIEKPGDIQLFEALAAPGALPVWRDPEGRHDATILKDYVAAAEADYNQTRFKIPAYRHPDPLRHPVFCEFGKSRWNVRFDCQNGSNSRDLTLSLWVAGRVEKTRLSWHSKRLARDLALGTPPAGAGVGVVRSDRLGRAAVGAPAEVRVLNVFDERDWNGRLQADRRALEEIAHLRDRGKSAAADRALRTIRWFLTFSPQLKPAGPFISYAASHALSPNRKGQFFPNSEANRGRGGLAKLSLARLPGLRVLGVDLGHRHAAACAVWKALSLAETAAEIGTAPPPEAMFLRHPSSKVDHEATTIYRRLAADSLPGGEPHPAPWARLERQFHVKLQGEDRPARAASRGEIERFLAWDRALGRTRRPADAPPRPVVELMAEALRTARYALRRHGDRARIAHNLTASEAQLPGGRTARLDRNGRLDLLAETLALWQALFCNDDWADAWAEQQWLASGLPPGQAGGEGVRAIAEGIVGRDLAPWSRAWAARWAEDDAFWSARDGYLRQLRAWLVPRGLDAAACGAARGVGGLSLTRIANLTSLYRLLKAFKMRPEPQDPRKNVPAPGDESLANFHGRLLATRDRLREQRARQLASRIAEAALGLGRLPAPRVGRDPKRPARPTDAPCHAVVIENLEHYNPDETRTRRENRQIMDWSAGRLRKLLEDGCQLHGLYLRQVPAAYTSRQCSRTGSPGVRCAELDGRDLLDSRYWANEVARARVAAALGAPTPEARVLIALADRLAALRSAGERLPHVRILRAGGPAFLAVRAGSRAPGASARIPLLDADLNAAANIGLRALLDPDWPGRWWYVPCNAGAPVAETSGSAAFNGVARLGPALSGVGAVRNLWRDVSASALQAGPWLPYGDYWSRVREQAADLLVRLAGAGAASAADVPF